MESDNQADLPVLDEVEVVPVRSTKRKASSDENIGESKTCEEVKQKNQRKSRHGLLNGLNLTHITGKLPLKMPVKGKSRLQPQSVFHPPSSLI